jgi:hypothetical protein
MKRVPSTASTHVQVRAGIIDEAQVFLESE